MTDRFAECLPIILKFEGGYSAHPSDPGGATMKGITQASFDSWRNAHQLPMRPVKEIEAGEVIAIYAESYWHPAGCENLPAPLDLIQFDTAVQRGPVKAVKMLQAILGVPVDGIFGAQTRRTAEAMMGKGLCTWYLKARETHYKGRVEEDPTQAAFIKGWMARLAALRAASGLDEAI